MIEFLFLKKLLESFLTLLPPSPWGRNLNKFEHGAAAVLK